jgi:adenylate cyclase
MEHRVRRFDGEYRWVHETQVARFTPEGMFAGFVGALVDITDRKHAESERMRLQTQLADADRQRAVLARHFSPNMVEELMRSGGQLEAVRTQPMTVLFADLFNFTAMSATTPMTEVIELLRRFHTLVEEAVFGNNGTLDKYIGDGVMATFGTPLPGVRDATNAVACARDLVRDINRWNREREAGGLSPLRIGVGLHCGEATIGNVGSARRFEHTVVGEIVNLASRIENLTRTLDIAILISDAIVEEVKREAGHAMLTGFDQRGAQSIRGYPKRIGLWGLTAVAIGVD